MLSAFERAFLAKFLVLFFVPFTALHFVDASLLNAAVASSEHAALSFLGYDAAASGSDLFVDGTHFRIVVDCTGLVLVLLLFALLFATPLKNAVRLRALAVFAPFLLFFNLLRLLLTLSVGAVLGQAALEAVHVLLWFVDSAVVFFIWMQVVGVRLSWRVAGMKL
ncbi:MAG: archaeosortase/exosortase family protein [Candidatus Micrarchaeota archaeon]